MYGAGAAKLAATLGRPESQGAKVKEEFYKAHPAIAQFITALERAYDRNGGYVKGIDGRPLYVRKKMSLLNTILQNAAAVVFKKWMVKCDKMMPDYIGQMIAYHDELQFEVHEDDEGMAKTWGRLVVDNARRVGKEMELEVPIDAEAKVGKNWADCH